MMAVAIRIFKQLLNDKRSLVLVMVVPLVVMTFLFFIFGDSGYIPKLGVVDINPAISASLEADTVELTQLTSVDNSLLEDGTLDAILYMDSGKLVILMLEMDSTKVQLVTGAVSAAIKAVFPAADMLQVDYIYGTEAETTFESLGHILLGVFAFFFVFLIAGVSFVRERTLGTMERFLLSPIRRSSVVLGFLFGFGLFAVIQSVLMVVFVEYVLGLHFASSIIPVLLIMVLFAFVAVALGSLVSTFAENEFQVAQFIPIIIVPQILLSGMIPIDLIPLGLGNLAYVCPVYYACDALDALMTRGVDIVQVLPQAAILLGFVGLLFFGNTLLLKNFRTI